METNKTQSVEPRQEDELDQLNTCLAELSSICGTQYPGAERLLAEATDAAARLRDRMAKLKADAYTDPLTGLPNRTAYTYDLTCVWDRQLEHTIAYIDIDGLKICNDRFGHPAGNRYITKVASRLKLHCHPDEHIYRIGGDEFVLISLTDSVDTLSQRLKACRASLATSMFDDGKTPMSYSYGCAHANPQAGDVLLDADAIKLDSRFMPAKAHQANRSENIVKSIINMSWEIGMPVIVEGVETEKQVTFLRDLGSRYVQGYYYYRPMPVESFEKFLASGASIDPRGILLHDSERHIDFAK